jgi:hypothetical protein
MRRLVVLMLASGSLLVFGAAAAEAKGDIHAKVTVSGAGLPNGIVTLDDDGVAFFEGSGVWQRKWDVPNIGGSLEADAKLGRRYVVRVVVDCGDGVRSRYRQSLYPDAPGGPQLYTPDGLEVCGAPAEPGYDPIGATLESILRSHGVEFRPTAEPTAPAPAEAAPDGGGGSVISLAVIGVPFALALLAGGEIVRRRRRR